MQHATEAVGVPLARGLNVAETKYAYDVNYRSGVVDTSIIIWDIVHAITKDVQGVTAVCPVKVGALVSSVAGGVIEGFDMYGQFIRETVAPAGTGVLAFAGVTKAPADAKWTNTFGLPYRYSAAAPTPVAGITITAGGPAIDSRGTWTVAAGVTAKVAQRIAYRADQTALFGAPYSTRFKSPDFGSLTLAITGTITTAGVITLTIPTAGAVQVECIIRYPDGAVRTAMSLTAPVYTLSKVWMSQYAKQIGNDPKALARLVTVDPAGDGYKARYIALIGALMGDPADNPTPPEPEPDPGVLHGPFTEGTVTYWVSVDAGVYLIGFNLDDESEADVWITPAEVNDLSVPQKVRKAIAAQLVALGWE